MKKNTVRLTEAQLHRVIKESVNRILQEGLFGNDAKYGEKWWNPFSWKSDKQKSQIDTDERARQKRLKDIRQNRERQAEQDRQNYAAWRKRENEKQQAKYDATHGPKYGHAGESFNGGTSAYDAGLR